MTTQIPTQSTTGPMDNNPTNDIGLNILIGSMSRVEDAVSRLRDDVVLKFDSLGTKFVPRPEIQQKWEESARDRSELRSMVAAQGVRLETEVEKLNLKFESAHSQRIVDRRWAIGTLLTTIALLVAIASVYLSMK